MYPNNLPESAAVGGGYVPYFYQRGLHYLYQVGSPSAPTQAHAQHGGSQGSSSLHDAFKIADRLQTVEQIIESGYFAVPETDPVMAIIVDKQHTSRLGLDDVIGQIRHRYELYEQNFYQIQRAKCAAVNAIYHHEAYQGPGTASSRQHYAKHKAIQDLYAQEREERVNLWRDVSRLRLQLPESAQTYLASHRKVTALTTPAGDGP